MKWRYKHNNKWQRAPARGERDEIGVFCGNMEKRAVPNQPSPCLSRWLSFRKSGPGILDFFRRSQIQIFNKKFPGLKCWHGFAGRTVQTKRNSSVSLTWPVGCQLMTLSSRLLDKNRWYLFIAYEVRNYEVL